MSSPRERQKSRLPLAALLLVALILLLIGLLNNLDDASWSLRKEPQVVEKVPDKDLSQQVIQKNDMSAGSKALRATPSPTPEVAEAAADGDSKEFPKTTDFATSTALELAMLQEPGEIVGWVTDSKTVPIAGALVRLKFEKSKPKTEKEEEKEPKFEVHTNDAGLFLMPKVPPGQWSVIAEKESYATAVATGVDVEPRGRTNPVVLRLDPEIRVKGVVKAGDQVISGATVTAFRDHLSVHDAGNVEPVRIIYTDVYTNEKGEFDLPHLPAGEMTLRVKAVGFVPVNRKIEITAKMEPIEIKLESESVIIGSVRNELGKPIENAELTLTPLDVTTPDKPLSVIKSEKGGGFIFRELPAKFKFNLFVKAENYAPYGPEQVASGSTTNVIILQSGGVIEGKVTNYDDGKPVPGISIVAISQSTAQPVALTTKTNTSGQYRITRLVAGTYDVAVNSPSLTSETKLGVAVALAAATKGVDFSVYPGINISGHVVDGDSYERIVNAKVMLKSRVGPGFLIAKNTEAMSDESGSFQFINLPQGLYDLTAEATGYVRGLGDESNVRVEALRDSPPEPVEIKLVRGGTIEGIVTDPNGSAIEEALVQLFHATGSPARIRADTFKTTTNSDGYFVLDGIPLQGELHLYVSAWAKDYGKARSDMVILNRDINTRNVQVMLGDGTGLQVVVLDPFNEGVANANLELVHSQFPGDASPPAWRQTTARDGTVLFEKVPPGRVTVSASRSGYLTTTGGIDISDKDEFQKLTITMQPAFVLAGRVQDDLLQPVRAGRVNARPQPGAKGSGSAGINADSTFKIETLGEGAFNVETIAQLNTDTGGRQIVWSFPDIVPNGGLTETAFTMPINGALEGRVLIADVNGPPPNYTVSLTATYRDDADRRQGFNAAFTFSKRDEFRFDMLPPGEYRVNVSAPNYLPVSVGPFDVESPGVFSVGTIKLNPGGSLKYKVVNSDTGEPINGARGKLDPEGPAANSDGEGKTLISPIKPGIYTLTLTHPDYLEKSFPLIQIVRGKEADEGVLAIDPGAKLYGTVTDGIGNPAAGILVEAHAINEDVLRRTTTDASGNYTLRGLFPGTHDLTYSGRVNSRRVTKNLQATVFVYEDTRQDVELWANSELEGRMFAASDVDLRRAIVTLYPMRSDNYPLMNDAIRVTDILSDGFSAKNLIEGYYLISVQAPGRARTAYFADTALVRSRKSATMLGEGTIQLNGRILAGPGGSAVASQEVRIDLLSSPQSGVVPLRKWWQWNTKTDKSGMFYLGKLPAGTYSIIARNETLKSDILEVITLTNDQQLVTRDFAFGGSAPEKKKNLVGN
ncbi:carboxypeptidase regulatory-like domain-containing protein [Candidatus Sumerlaeota bacterium]|nr:carboxypeptidase regulatory-like domain-containing protein [Candidatus Sumerlaeota bacterium]